MASHSADGEYIDPVVLRMHYRAFTNFNYLMVDPATRRAVIVDPAWEMDKVDWALIDAEATLAGILLTHSHPDHVHLAKPLAAKYHCPIWMSDEEIRMSGFRAPQLVGIGVTPWMEGTMKITPLATPGHTSGGICYLIGGNLFTGDTLFAEGCGICLDTGAAHDMYGSLEGLKKRLPPETRVFPGHSYGKMPGQSFSTLLRENIYLQLPNKDVFAAFRLRRQQSIRDKFGV